MKAKERDRWVRHYDLHKLANNPVNIATDWLKEWTWYQHPAEFQKLAIKLLLRIEGDN
jgi:hypothetical protein|tara:strand:+ start:697 stop:870 length:174 start_codon:yes stop_codon:yes gene_type:complete